MAISLSSCALWGFLCVLLCVVHVTAFTNPLMSFLVIYHRYVRVTSTHSFDNSFDLFPPSPCFFFSLRCCCFFKRKRKKSSPRHKWAKIFLSLFSLHCWCEPLHGDAFTAGNFQGQYIQYIQWPCKSVKLLSYQSRGTWTGLSPLCTLFIRLFILIFLYLCILMFLRMSVPMKSRSVEDGHAAFLPEGSYFAMDILTGYNLVSLCPNVQPFQGPFLLLCLDCIFFFII